MKKATKILIPVLLFLAFILLLDCFYTVKEDEYACTMRFSKIESTVSEAGIYLKVPFIDEIRSFPKAMQLYDIPPSEVLTADKQNMTVDSYIVWQISDPVLFYKSIGSIGVAESRLDAVTYNALKTRMGTLMQSDVINRNDASERNVIYDGIAEEVSEVSESYGIRVIDVKVKRIDLPDANESAVYTRMISERTQMAEKFTANGEKEATVKRNEVDKEVNIIISDAEADAAKIEAEGEATYMQMLAEAYDTQDKKDFYTFCLALDAIKASLDGENKTVILDKDSALVKQLLNP